jgi:hypothetical protein
MTPQTLITLSSRCYRFVPWDWDQHAVSKLKGMENIHLGKYSLVREETSGDFQGPSPVELEAYEEPIANIAKEPLR